MAIGWTPLQHCVLRIVLGCGLCASAAAELPLIRSYSAIDGLPSQRVYDLEQDPDGFLWAATADGLARFDGRRFEVFRHRPRDPNSLPANVTQVIHVDALGRLWVGSEGGGLVRRDLDGRFVPMGRQAGEADPDIWAIASERSGTVWFGGFATGLRRLDADGRSLQIWRAGEAQGLVSDYVLWLHVDRQQQLWVGSDQGLQRLQGERLISVQPKVGSFGNVYRLVESPQGLLLATENGVFRQHGDRFERIGSAASGVAFSVWEESAERLWVGRPRGIEQIEQGQSRLFSGPARERYSPGAQPIMDMLQDHEGGLWLASAGGGLLRLAPQWQRFRSWLSGRDGLATAAPSAVAFDRQGRLWVAGVDGIVERIEPDGRIVMTGLPAGFNWANQQIGALWPAPNGDLWIGQRRGLMIHRANGSMVDLTANGEPDRPVGGLLDLIQGDAQGGVWLSYYGVALEHRDADGRLLARYRAEQGLQPPDSEQLRLDPQGRPWLAGGQGLLRLNPTNDRFEAVPGLAGDRVFGFVFQGDDQLWLARRNGLFKFARRGQRWQAVQTLDVLDGLEVGGLSLDRHGALWASSSRGLLRIDPQRGRLRRYSVLDGLPGQELASRPLAEAANGEFAAVLPEAVLRIDPDRFLQPSAASRLRAEPLHWQREGRSMAHAAGGRPVLGHDAREISLGARVVSFSDPQRWRYRSRLSPYDRDWVDQGSEGSRVFSSLPPGDYQWQIEAAGDDEQWQALPPLPLRVDPPWWQRTEMRLAQLLVMLLLAGLLWRALQARANRRAAAALAQQQHRWALQANAQKSRFLANLAHEIRTPMTGVLGMAELLERTTLDARQRAQVQSMRAAGDLLLRLVNEALDLARIEAGTLELRPRPFQPRQLLEECGWAGRALIHGRPLQLRCEVEAAVPQWLQGDADRIRQILLNLLGNALKFSEQGEVMLAIAVDPDGGYRFWVRDCGPGLDAEQQARMFQRFSQAEGEDTARRFGGSGLGLAICKELARLMGGRLALHSVPAQGTEVLLWLDLPEAPPAPATAPSPVIPAQETAAVPGRVLLVEDDELLALTLQGQLAAAGFIASSCGHALAALSLLNEQPFDLALLDLDLPGMDGLELAGLLRASHPNLPLVAITARAEADLAGLLLPCGFQAWLRKPAGIDALQQCLLQVLRDRQQSV